jgi:putative DNA primase/helicase
MTKTPKQIMADVKQRRQQREQQQRQQEQRQQQQEQRQQQQEQQQRREGARVLPPPSEPMRVARQFVSQQLLYDGSPELPTLRFWHGGWWAWRTAHWVELEPRGVRSLLYQYTEHAVYPHGPLGVMTPWAPSRRKVGDLLEALGAIVILSDEIEQPCWIDSRANGNIVAVANGLLDITTRNLYEHTPRFFNQTSVPFDYDPHAPAPQQWLGFLSKLWPNEPEAIDALAQWFGYVISGRLDLHKILLMVGPTRGGKGVIARVLTALVGRRNVAGPTLHSLGGDFGLAPLIGKSLAIISDARFVGRNSNVVVERLLSISGEDTLTVNRKYRDQWTGKLPSRLHVISNELPKLGDASTAIIGRIVLLMLSRSWLGKEDHNLEAALHAELPGILNWALAGLERLTISNANRFTAVASAEDAIRDMRDLASPVAAFVREQCVTGPDYEIDADRLYTAYRAWCEANENPKSSKHVFGRDLAAAIPAIRKQRRGRGADRHYVYVGIALREATDEPDEPML